jgi:glycosyltransferase involved in cell wall biosynthesis
LENLRRYFADEPAMKFSGMDGASFGDAVLAWLAVPVEERRRLGLAASRRVARDLDWRAVTGNAVRAVETMTGNPAEAGA